MFKNINTNDRKSMRMSVSKFFHEEMLIILQFWGLGVKPFQGSRIWKGPQKSLNPIPEYPVQHYV